MTAETVTVLIAPGPGEHGIPLDVAATLTKVIGLAYPTAQMGQGEFGRGFTLILDKASRRPKRVTKKAATDAHTPMTDDDVDVGAGVVGFDGESLRVDMPETLALELGTLGYALLGSLDAVNYVETQVGDADGNRVVVTVRRPEGKTAHELRLEAEAEVERLRAVVGRIPEEQCHEHDDGEPGDEHYYQPGHHMILTRCVPRKDT